ncbi:lipopolysaccharide biosynthesis protein [Liquorilactobacillus oeni]|uniref:Oligosaccharide translocase n=1 Tax=Liquorilactobacillus oeni DSM 19972 TaxID=1423777 RepID=A0A0R1MJB3_9LACO|nr:hypothetical protein [Liquorilactobacillus oeni]KRL04571.1 oligosaccharide translocase [Liquorilactobacillus oeni DSM 19972]
MKKNRLQLSMFNSLAAVLSQGITIILRFCTQTVFINVLGATYLGVNGLFNNILGILSFADLGVGSAITFALYKPLLENNHELINSIMSLYRKAYHIIGLLVGILGLCVMPFLPLLIKEDGISQLYLLFLLFLANTVVSYLLSYKQTLLIADQIGYNVNLGQLFFLVIQTFLQISALLFFKSFVLYLIIQLTCTFFLNVTLAVLVSRKYPFLTFKKKYRLPPQIYQKIKKNTVGMVGAKVGEISLNATDNIVISTFIGIYWVGIYSNYLLIINSISLLLIQFTSSVSASIGNYALDTSSKAKAQYTLFKKHLLVNYVVTFMMAVLLESLLNPFITLWIGERYTLRPTLVTLIVLNFGINALRQTPITFITSYGLFDRIGVKSVIEALVNVGLSLIFVLVFKLGIIGVFIGTLCTNLFVNLWYEPLVVLRHGIKIPEYTDFYRAYFMDIVFLVLTLVITSTITTKFFLPGVIGLVLLFAGAATCTILLLFLYLRKNSEYLFFVKLIKSYCARFFS